MSIAAIILSAGRGERAGVEEGPKQYRLLDDRAVIYHTVLPFIRHKDIDPIIVVIHPDDHDLARNALAELYDQVTLVEGGATRQQSTLNGLLALGNNNPDFVHIHDGARPFIHSEQLDQLHQSLHSDHGILLALPVSDTLKRIDEKKYVTDTVPRARLYAAQTPQSFPYHSILSAHKAATQSGNHDFTDDSSIAEWAGLPMSIVSGAPDNIKITWRKDIETARQKLLQGSNMFPDIRTGNGYDVHAFEEGDHVTLCGVKIPNDKKLNGHSDADVALHALTDALLSTCGAGDIGTHFPPSDPQWKGASSDIFVRHAAQIVREKGGRISNVAITLIAEAPRVGPYRDQMMTNLSQILAITQDRVSLTATTNEKMGFVGRKEGIAAIATATVIYPGEVPQ